MRTVFLLANILIALDYALIGTYFLGRLRLPASLKAKGRKVLLATSFAVLFFFGCVHTHIDLLVSAAEPSTLGPHWYSWWNVTSHVLQGIGGFGFWLLARRYLVINIFDRKLYESAVKPETKRRLDYLEHQARVIGRRA